MIEVPLQAVDTFLTQFHVGHVLVGAFVLAVLGSLPLKSTKVLALNVALFGAIFVLTPISLTGDSIVYRLVGVSLLIVGPMLYVVAEH